MKKALNKNSRIGIRVASVLGIVGILLNLIFWNSRNEIEVNLYDYTQNGNVNYDVVLKPNNIFRDNVLGENKIYFTEFLDHLKCTFKYEFRGQDTARINGHYEIIAVIEGYSSHGDGERAVWKEEFIILSPQDISYMGTELVIEEKIYLDLQSYLELAEQVEKATKVRLDTQLSVFMNVDVNIDSGEGSITEEVSPSLTIPIANNQFEVLKGEFSEDKNMTGVQNKELDLKSLGMQLTFIVILLCIFIYTNYYTFNAQPKTMLEREITKIFKEHAGRLVALDHEVEIVYTPNYKLKTMEDLVKVADELEKPIMYFYRYNKSEVKSFFVFDHPCKYTYEIKNT